MEASGSYSNAKGSLEKLEELYFFFSYFSPFLLQMGSEVSVVSYSALWIIVGWKEEYEARKVKD